MARRRDQQGTLYKVERKTTGTWFWWGRYRLYNTRGKAEEQRTCIGPVAEFTEKQARKKLVELIERMNRRANSIHSLNPEDVLKAEIAFAGPRSRFLSGAISELVVAADLMARGYEVFRPLCAQSSCDLIAMKNGEFQRIEVKTDNLSSIRRNIGKFDIAAVYCKETGRVEYRSALELSTPKTLPEHETNLSQIQPASPLES